MSRHEDFQRDGGVCVRGVFSTDDVELLEQGIERNLAEPSGRALVASRPDDPGRFFEDFRNWQRIPEFEQFIRESPAAAIAGELMGSRQVRLFHDHLLVKEPGDAVFFHMLTLHAAGGATRRRRAFSVRFLGDDASHAPRAWKTSPDFPGLVDELPAGAPMDHPLFLVVWEHV